MIFTRINQIEHKPTRHVARAAVRAHLIFLKLVLLKTIIFNIAGLKTIVTGSALLMGLFHFIPHMDIVEAANTNVDMSISDTVYPVVSDTGEINVYMIFVQNETPSVSASNVQVTATIPAGTTYDSASISPSSISATQVTWNLPSNDNSHVMILLRLLVDPNANGTVTSTATVSATNPDPYMNNNTANASIVVGNNGSLIGNVDLYATKQVDQSEASVTDELTYTISYGNLGTDTANNTKIYDIIPNNMYVISADPAPTSTTGANGSILVWDAGNLAGGMGGEIELKVSLYPLLKAGSEVENNAVIDSDVFESNFDNNVGSAHTTIVEGESKLAVNIFTQDTTVCVGDTVPFVINFANEGMADANGVTVVNQIPSALQYLYSSEPYASVSGSSFKRNIAGQLYPGDQGSFTVTTKAVAAGVGVTNIVIANEQGVPVASGSFQIDVLTPEVCDYLGSGNNNNTGNTNTGTNNTGTNNTGNTSTGNTNNTDPQPQTYVDMYNVLFSNDTPALNTAVDVTIELIPNDNTKVSYTRNLNVQVQKKSGSKWSAASADQYTLSIPTVSADFLKTSQLKKTWKKALTFKTAGAYRLKVSQVEDINAYGFGYITPGGDTTTQAEKTTSTGTTTTGTTNPKPNGTGTNYITGTNIGTGTTTGFVDTIKPIDKLKDPAKPKSTDPTSIPKTTRPAATKPKTKTTDPNNPYVRSNASKGATYAQKTQKEMLDAIKKATSTYSSKPVTCEDGYRDVYEFAKLMKLTSARSLDDFKPCAPITRIDAVKVFVLYLLGAAVIDPNLNTQMKFTDVADLNNEQLFYLNLFLDFRLGNEGTTFRPFDNINRQETALIVARMTFGTEYIKSPATQFQDAMNLMHQALLMKDTDNGTDVITKGDLFSILYRGYFGDTLQSSRYITVIKNKK